MVINISKNVKYLLLVTSVIFVLQAANFFFNPPVEGDAYEFAEITQNLVSDGQWREDHIRGAGVTPDMPSLPHPPGRRGTLEVFFYVPFYILFQESYLTVVTPYLFCLLLLPLIFYLVARRHFSEWVSFWSSIALTIQPMIFSFASEDPTPTLLILLLLLLTTDQFLRENFLLTGIFLGLCILIKESMLVFYPTFFLWILCYRRSYFRNWKLYMGFALSILVFLPMILVRAQYYSNPVTCEDGAFMAGDNYNLQEQDNATKFLHGISLVEQRPQAGQKNVIGQRLRVITSNLNRFFFGTVLEYNAFAGVPELLSLFLLPFIPFGFWFFRREAKTVFISLWIVLFIVMHILLVDFYEDRYYFPILPFAYLLAMQGIEKIKILYPSQNGWKWKVLFAVILLFEVLPTYTTRTFGNLMTYLSNDDAMQELQTFGQYIQREVPAQATMMTMPYFSSPFYFKRLTTFLPHADYAGLQRFQKKYNQQYIVANNFVELGSRDAFPEILRGRNYSLYKIEQTELQALIDSYPEFGKLNPVGRILRPARVAYRYMPFQRVLYYALSSWWKALFAYLILIVLVGALLAVNRGQLKRLSIIVVIVVILIVNYFYGDLSLARSIDIPAGMEQNIVKVLGLDDAKKRPITVDIFMNDKQYQENIFDRMEQAYQDRDNYYLQIPVVQISEPIRDLNQAYQVARMSAGRNAEIDSIKAMLRMHNYRVFALQSRIIAIKSPHESNAGTETESVE